MAAPENSPAPALSQRLGEYRILRLLGEGGMGAVYEAEQQRTRRLVALKVIRPGRASLELLRRFEHEAVVLARLQHPGIAQILEAGTFDAPDGGAQPYFAMELIRGVPLTKHAEAAELDVRGRLLLLSKLCAALQHAHERGVVHRDLKPANILVDATGQPKILDFGVARVTDSDVQLTTMHTDVGQLIGTIAYMSPEQAAGDSREIDARSDVYALGVIGYELLAGQLPYDLRKRVLHEAVRIIREDDPTPLSSVNRQLRGDIETILLKALEKDKARRYASAGDLATDIEHYLRDEAIAARPASSWYQLQKFTRRNRVMVAGVAATFVALVAGLVVSARMYVRERDARDLAETRRKDAELARAAESQQRELAVGNEAKAQAINDFLLEMLSSADLRHAGREAKVAEALGVASSKVGASFTDRPAVELGLRDMLARTYLSLGMPDEAEPHVERTVELSVQLFGERSQAHVSSLHCVATLQTMRGNPELAVATLRKSVPIAESVQGPDGASVMSNRSDLANALRTLKRYSEAEPIARALLAQRRRVYGDEAAATLISINSLAVLLHEMGQLEEAERLYREAAETGERKSGRDDPDALTAWFNVGSMHKELGRNDEAQALFTELMPRMRTVFGDRHPKTATALMILAWLHQGRGRYSDALPLMEEALQVTTRIQGERGADVGERLASIAMVHSRLGNNGEAITCGQRAAEILSERLGREHAKTLDARTGLANALVSGGRNAEAEELFRDLVEVSNRVLGPDDLITAVALNSYGVLLQRLQRYDEAEPLLRRALEGLKRAFPEDHRDTAITQHNLMWVLRQRGDLEGAVEQAIPTVARFERAFGPRHPNTAQAMAGAGSMLRAIGRYEEAEAYCRSALEIRREAFGSSHPQVARALTGLAHVRFARDDADEALSLATEALAMHEAQPKPEAFHVADTQGLIGACFTRAQRYAEAETLLLASQTAIAAASTATGGDRRDAVTRLVGLYDSWNAAEPDAARSQSASEWKAKLDSLPASVR